MEAVKVGLGNFVINIPAEYFHTPMDGQVIINFHVMYIRRKDLDVA
jgi:hypothetical protein